MCRNMNLGVGVLSLGVLACARPAQLQPNTEETIRDALMAQVEGIGGCKALERTEEVSDDFFPHIRLYVGYCNSEHGDGANGIVGVEQTGGLYLLDSSSGFNFLLRRTPPIGLDSSSVVKYAARVLAYIGERPWDWRLVAEPSDIDGGKMRRLGIAPDALPRSGVRQRVGGSFVVSLCFESPEEVIAFDVTVSLDSGMVVVVHRTEWPSAS